MFWPNQEYERLKPVRNGPWGAPPELGISVWSTARQRLKTSEIDDLKEIEKIQKRATKLVIKLKNKSYIDRLIYLNLPIL